MLIENVQELLKEELDRAFVAHETLKYLWIKYPDMSIQDFLKLPMQVLVRAFGALGFLKPEYNFYLNFTNFLKDHYDLSNMRVLEIGCGTFPILAENLAKETKREVYAFDQQLSKEVVKDNLITFKQMLTSTANIPQVNLIVGLHFCEGSLVAIDLAKKFKTDLCIAPCKCIHNCDYHEDFLWQNDLDNNSTNYKKFLFDYSAWRLNSSFQGVEMTKKAKNLEYIY